MTLRHPQVLEAAAFAVPGEFGEDDVKLDVVLKDDLDLAELHAWLVENLPRFMVPRYVERREAFPKTPSERVEKYKLAEEGAERPGRARRRRGAPARVRVTLGAPGQIMPPAARAIDLARRAEADGFDAVWWPCHLMGWHPDSVWSEDLTPLAGFQSSPHVYFEPLSMMAAAAAVTERIRVGVCVTDVIRRHPAMLAQTALTLDHVAGGRAILGLGSGERMNITPYGMEWSRPYSRLAEAIDVMRLLWSSDGPVDFDGRFFRLEDAVLGLEPLRGPPPAGLDRLPRAQDARAHRPPGRRLAAHPDAARGVRREAGRRPPGGRGRRPRPRRGDALHARLRPRRARRRDARAHVRRPAGAAVVPGRLAARRRLRRARACGRPSRAGPATRATCPPPSAAPRRSTWPSGSRPRSSRSRTLNGDAAAIAGQIRALQEAGLRDVVLWNITAFADPSLAGYSFTVLREVRELLAG